MGQQLLNFGAGGVAPAGFRMDDRQIQMTETFYLKPRLSATIDYNGNKCL